MSSLTYSRSVHTRLPLMFVCKSTESGFHCQGKAEGLLKFSHEGGSAGGNTNTGYALAQPAQNVCEEDQGNCVSRNRLVHDFTHNASCKYMSMSSAVAPCCSRYCLYSSACALLLLTCQTFLWCSSLSPHALPYSITCADSPSSKGGSESNTEKDEPGALASHDQNDWLHGRMPR